MRSLNKKVFCLLAILITTASGFCWLNIAIADRQIDVPLFGQRWEPWAGDQLGFCSSDTIGSSGCAITSMAMVFKYYGVNTDPRDLNNWLKQNGGYAEGCLVKWDVAAGRSGGSVQWAGRYDYQTVPAELLQRLEFLLALHITNISW